MTEREEYINKLKSRMDAWNAGMQKWEEKSRQATADAHAQAEAQIEIYRRQRDDAMAQMKKLQDATGDAWKELMKGTEEAWTKMREAYEKASSQFYK